MTTPQSVPLDLESLIEQRVAVERAQMQRALVFEAERIRWQAEQRVAEAFTVGGQRISTYADSIPPGWGFDYSLTGMPQIVMTEPTVTDTESGADPPKYRTEQDLARYRAMARFVTSVHCPGVGIIENLQNYIIGPGFTYKIRTKMGVRPPDGLVAAVQSFVDRFLDDNDWNGGFDRELLARSATDGEFILDLLGDREAVKSGRPRLEVLEPHFLTECGQWPEVSDRYSFPTSFTFGVHSHATKPFQVLGYSIQGSGAWRYATTSHIVHHKQNVHRNAKRGVSDFFPAWEWLESQSRLLKNTAAGAAELSAIAYILKNAGASESKVQSMLAGKADVTYTGPNGQTFYKQWKPPGSVINAPAGAEYEPGPAGHERGNAFIQVVQGILKQVATRWCMSEGMVSADDSNNNMASSIVAGSRFHRYAVCRQANLSQRFSTIIWKAIQIAYNAGAFSVYGFSPNRAGGEYSKMESLLELKIECPPVDELSKLDQDSIYAARVSAGAMSKSTWRDKVGLDDAVEKENLKKEAAEGQPTQPPAEAPPGMPVAAPEKPVAAKEEMLARPIQEVFCPTGKDGGVSTSSPNITESASPTKLSCLMAMLGKEDADAVLKLAESIDASDFAEDGREAEPHCTVKYGFLTQDFQDIAPLVKGLPALSLTLGNLSVFTGKEHDVLKLDVESPEIVQLNQRVSDALPHVNTYHDYIPHVTVGYLKPGAGKKYAGPCEVTGRNVVVSRLVFSPAEGDKVTIPLEKREPVMEQANDVDPSAVIALSTARDAAESLSLRASCRRFVEEHGQEGVRKLFESASKIEAGKSGYCQKMLWQYP